MVEEKLRGFDKICDSLDCTPAEKAAAHSGARIFMEQGWPISCFSVPMAIHASRGYRPSRYKRVASKTRYEHGMVRSQAFAHAAANSTARVRMD